MKADNIVVLIILLLALLSVGLFSCRDAGEQKDDGKTIQGDDDDSTPQPTPVPADDDDVIEDDDDDDNDNDDDDDNDNDDDSTPDFSIPIVSITVSDGTEFCLTNPWIPAWTGDLWPTCWGRDDLLYTANGDGFGFGVVFADIVFGIIEGMPPNLEGRSVPEAWAFHIAGKWEPDRIKYSRKPTGLYCGDDAIYLFYQNLANALTDDPFGDAPHASISRTSDNGANWDVMRDAPMFTDHIFTTGFFLDFGKADQYAIDGYVYVYGLDYNWRFSDEFSQTKLYLARVPKNGIMDREQWSFFSGMTGDEPDWSGAIDQKQPVILDETVYINGKSGISQGSVVYIPALNRYLYSTRAVYEWIFWEAPAPWGPWTKITVQEWTGGWTEQFHAGYNAVIPSKFLNEDGLGGWIVSSLSDSWFQGAYYNMNWRQFELEIQPADNQ